MPRSNPVPSAGVGRKSYGKLFSTTMPAVANIQTTPRTAPSAGTRDQPRVVCGTTLVEVDPALDPNIRIERPADHTHYAIKTIEPAVCRR